MRFTSIDFEKANNDSCSVCSIGVSVFNDKGLLFSNTYLVQPPGNEYLDLHTSIHGITAEDTCGQPYFPEIWKRIREDIEEEIVVAHNGSTVEFPILKSLFTFYEMRQPAFKPVCTQQLSQQLFPYLKNYKLSTLAEVFNIEFDEKLHHDAKYDSEIAGFIFMKMNQLFRMNSDFQPDRQAKKITEKKNSFSENFASKKVDSSLIYPTSKPKYENHYFYAKKIVITGEFTAFPKQRNRLAQILFDCGADINTAISKQTDLVLVGTGAGAKKLEKISALSIAVMNEVELLKLIREFMEE